MLFLRKKKLHLTNSLGSNDLDQFTIEIYDDLDVLNKTPIVDNVGWLL